MGEPGTDKKLRLDACPSREGLNAWGVGHVLHICTFIERGRGSGGRSSHLHFYRKGNENQLSSPPGAAFHDYRHCRDHDKNAIQFIEPGMMKGVRIIKPLIQSP